MPRAEVDIEAIVREVVRRLRAMDAGNGHSTTTPIDPGSLELRDKVITLSTLEKQLSGVRKVTVARGAIVTPAVMDELKDREIELVRCSNMNGKAIAGTHRAAAKTREHFAIVVAQDNCSIDINALEKQLPSAQFVRAESNSLESTLETIAASTSQGQLAVLLTNTPSSAVIAANRNPQIRAAVGFNFPAVRRAVDEAGANLLAIDPSGRSNTQVVGLINEFLHRN